MHPRIDGQVGQHLRPHRATDETHHLRIGLYAGGSSRAQAISRGFLTCHVDGLRSEKPDVSDTRAFAYVYRGRLSDTLIKRPKRHAHRSLSC